MTMIMVNIFEVKAKLSEYLDAVARGERVMICKRNRPIAELRPVSVVPAQRRLGMAAGAVTMGPSFFEPLPEDVLDAFEKAALTQAGASKVAESRETFGAKKGRRK